MIANAQLGGGIAAFIDAEHALDIQYARRLGIDVDNLLVSQPDTGEQALEIAEVLIRSNAVDVIVVDSVAALVPRAEIEGEMGDSHVGLQARLMSQALRKLTGAVSRSNAAVIFTNQIREKIGVMFGSPETTSGGRALKFYASLRMDIRRIGALKDGPEIIGNRTRVKVVKNKCAPPFKQAEFDILYGKGNQPHGSSDRYRCRAGSRRQVRVVVLLWRSAVGAGEGECPDLPRREHRHCRGDRIAPAGGIGDPKGGGADARARGRTGGPRGKGGVSTVGDACRSGAHLRRSGPVGPAIGTALGG